MNKNTMKKIFKEVVKPCGICGETVRKRSIKVRDVIVTFAH